MDPQTDPDTITQIRDTSLAEHHGIPQIETNIRMIVTRIKACILQRTIRDHIRGMKACLILYHSELGLKTFLHGHD